MWLLGISPSPLGLGWGIWGPAGVKLYLGRAAGTSRWQKTRWCGLEAELICRAWMGKG